MIGKGDEDLIAHHWVADDRPRDAALKARVGQAVDGPVRRCVAKPVDLIDRGRKSGVATAISRDQSDSCYLTGVLAYGAGVWYPRRGRSTSSTISVMSFLVGSWVSSSVRLMISA